MCIYIYVKPPVYAYVFIYTYVCIHCGFQLMVLGQAKNRRLLGVPAAPAARKPCVQNPSVYTCVYVAFVAKCEARLTGADPKRHNLAVALTLFPPGRCPVCRKRWEWERLWQPPNQLRILSKPDVWGSKRPPSGKPIK